MLNLNQPVLNQIIQTAHQTAARDQRWLNAIDKAARELIENPYIEAIDNHTLLIGSVNGQAYVANGTCQCKAYQRGNPCYHRAAARLYQRYLEAQDA